MIAFDKTGMLTYGKLEVSDMISFNETVSQEELLMLVASAEAKSEHPLGKAIVNYAKDKKSHWVQAEEFSMEAGKGIFASVSGRKLYCGSEKYLFSHGISIGQDQSAVLENLRMQGKALILIALDGECAGAVGLCDRIRSTAKEMIEQLSEMNTKTILLSGDNKKTAEYLAEQAEITAVFAELLPEEKVENIVRLQETGGSICMIGDGVNDAPALKTANVGVAMGSIGSDIAIEAADIALMGDDISKIPYLKRLSCSTLNTIKGNIMASMMINAVAITLSVLGLLNPITGALVHNAGSVLVVLNADFLYDRKF